MYTTNQICASNEKYQKQRIPGLLVTNKGTLLFYREARRNESDWALMDILLSRSEDHGKTFADAAVLYGIPRDQALALTAQMVMGSAKLQKETGLHPGVLKDMVCSPGGSTIKGVAALEEKGLRAACIAAIKAIMEG